MPTPPPQPQTETNRLEAFSDGVFAVAITLLALELKVPAPGSLHLHHPLAAALLAEWPAAVAYVLSFVSVLIGWVNHHALFGLVRRTDHSFLILNCLMLMLATAIPFGTEMLATYLRTPSSRTAMIVYNSIFLLLIVAFNAMWAYAAHNRRLLGADVSALSVQTITRQYRLGLAVCVPTFVLAFWSAPALLALSILVTAFFALPGSVRGHGRK